MMMFHCGILQHLVLNVLAGLQVVTFASATEGGGCYGWLLGNEYVKSRSENTTWFSELLSDQFFWLGQEPSVRLAGEENVDQLQAKVVYDNGSSIWKVTFDDKALFRYMGQRLLITGRDICLYECAVGNTMELINLRSAIHYDQGRVQAVNGMQRVGVIMEPCDKKTMLLLTSGLVFVSQNSLLSSEKLALPEFENRPVTLSGAVVLLMKFKSVSQHLIIVTNNGIITIASDDFGTKPLKTHFIDKKEFSMMTGVASSKWMCDLHSDDRQLMPIAFWNTTALAVTNINFTKPVWHSIPTSGIIKDVQFTGHRTTISILVFNPVSRQLSVWRVDRSHQFKQLCSWDAVIGSDSFTMIIAPVGVTAFYVWNDMAVYYYFRPRDDGARKLTIFGSENDEIGSVTDPIKQFVINYDLAPERTRQPGYCGLDFDIVPVLTTIDAESILSSDETGNFFIVTGNTLVRTPLDLSYRTVAKENATLKCPFLDFQISGRDMLNAFRVDLGEEVRVWCLLFLPGGFDDDIIQVDFERLEVINASVTNEVHAEERGMSQHKEIRFSIKAEKIQRASHGNTYVGHFGFQLEPVVPDDPGLVVCPLPRIMTGYIYVGCSGSKSLRIRRDEADDSECDLFRGKPSAPYKYTLRGDQLMYPDGSKGKKGKEDKTLEYDYATHGCPIKVHYTDVLLPELELVDDLTNTVKHVDGDFVMFERNDRMFGYNDTALGVRCSIAPQTWKEMAASASEPDMEYKWTPANYKSCHSAPTELEEKDIPNDPYQILNGSNIAGLTFIHSDSIGLYIFTAVVVDPNLSFCHLSTTFAVNVVGKIVRTDFLGLYITLGIFTFLLIVFVLATYFYYRDHVYGGK